MEINIFLSNLSSFRFFFSILFFYQIFFLTIYHVHSETYDCDPVNKKNSFILINDFPDGFKSFTLNLISNINQSNTCFWEIKNYINSSLLLKSLTLAPGDNLEIKGIFNSKNTTIFSGKNINNSGFIDIKLFDIVAIELSLKENTSSFVRSFSLLYTRHSPTILPEPDGVLTLSLNQENKTITSNFSLLPSFTNVNEVVFLLSFVNLPRVYNIDINKVTYKNGENELPTYLMTNKSILDLNIEHNPLDNLFTLRYWSVTKSCSGITELKVGDKGFEIPYVHDDDRKKWKLLQAKCVQVVKGVKDKQILVNIPSDISSLLNPQDSITFYDVNSHIELSLDESSILYYRNVDTFLKKDQYLVVYETPFFSDFPNKNFVSPRLSVVNNSGNWIIKDDETINKTIGNGKKFEFDEVHVIYTSAFLNPGVFNSRVLHLEFLTTQVTPGNWSILVYFSEHKSSQPVVEFGQSDLLPKVVPTSSGVMRVVFKGQLSEIKLRYRTMEKEKNCAFFGRATSQTSNGLGSFDIRGGQSDIPCTWLIPKSQRNFTILSPIYIRIPANKVLNLTEFSVKGSSVQQFKGPLDKKFISDFFLTSNSSYEFSIDPSGVSLEDDLHVMLEQRNDYINSSVFVDSLESSIRSINYPGKYPVGYSQTYLIHVPGKVLMIIQDMSLLPGHNFSFFSKETGGPIFVPNNLSSIYDRILFMPYVLSFNASQVNFNHLVDKQYENVRGFNIEMIHVSVGEELDVEKNKSFEIKAGNATFTNRVAVWLLKFDDKSSNIGDTILRINASFAEEPKKTKAKLQIFDSKSLRKAMGNPHEALQDSNSTDKDRRYVTSTRIAYVVYNFTDSVDTKLDFSIKFSVLEDKCSHSKNYTLIKCKTTDRCITDPMICNGVNDCGDWSDEQFCSNQPPIPPLPYSGSSGVSVIVAIFLLLLGVILGILGYVYLPGVLLRLRNGRYSEFRDLSSVS